MFYWEKLSRLILGLPLLMLLSQGVANAQEIPNRTNPGELEYLARKLGERWNQNSALRSSRLHKLAAKKFRNSGNLSKASTNLRESARMDMLLENYRSALSSLNEVSQLEAKNPDSDSAAITLSLISSINLKLGKSDASKKALDRALVVSQASKSLRPRAETNFGFAEYYYSKGKYQTATKFYRTSWELWKRIGDIRKEAEVLIDYGYVFMSTGDPYAGIAKVKLAERKLKAINNRRGLVMAKIALGHLHNVAGEKQVALALYREAELNFPENIDMVLKAFLYNGIAFVYKSYGDWQISLEYYNKSLRIFREIGHVEYEFGTLTYLIELSYLTNDDSSARKHIRNLERLSVSYQNDLYLTEALRFSGDHYFRKYSNNKALKYYKKALKNMRGFGIKYGIALITLRIGIIHLRQNRFDDARNHYEEALQITRDSSNKLVESRTLYRLAELELSEGKFEAALENARNSISLTEEFTTEFSNSKSTSNYFSSVYERYELYIELLMKMHERFPRKGFDVQALQASEKSRSRSLLENLRLSEANFTADADPGTVKREKETRQLLHVKGERLSNLLNANSEKDEVDKLDKEINQLRSTLEEIRAELKQKSPIYTAAKNPPTFDIKEFQNKFLDKNNVLLEFSIGKNQSYMWLLGKENLEVFKLPGKESIEKQIDKLRSLMIERGKHPNEDVAEYQERIRLNEKEYWKLAQTLSNTLFGEAYENMANKQLIVVPDGKLRYFPISALPVPNKGGDKSGSEPFLLHNEIVYEPSASTLKLLRNPERRSSQAIDDVLVFADPIFSKTDERLRSADLSAGGLKSFERLPASMEEADAIAQTLGSNNSTVVSGFSANRKNFLSTDFEKYKIVHFATHGLLNEKRPELSGIALSQFDEKGNSLDGFVRLQDIYAMKLSADLVVLSACDTGVGKEVKGEGLISLTNGFLQAGAKSVISSRWKVDDYVTLALMKDFYQILKDENVTPSVALRKAQINMYTNSPYKSPFYWAAFSVHGEFKDRPQFSQKFNYNNYFFLLIFAAVLFISYRIYTIIRKRVT